MLAGAHDASHGALQLSGSYDKWPASAPSKHQSLKLHHTAGQGKSKTCCELNHFVPLTQPASDTALRRCCDVSLRVYKCTKPIGRLQVQHFVILLPPACFHICGFGRSQASCAPACAIES